MSKDTIEKYINVVKQSFKLVSEVVEYFFKDENRTTEDDEIIVWRMR